jgi:hypothetical protein
MEQDAALPSVSSVPVVSSYPDPTQALPLCGPLARAWAMGGVSDEAGHDVIVAGGHVYIAGDFSRTVVFGEGQASEVTLAETGLR